MPRPRRSSRRWRQRYCDHMTEQDDQRTAFMTALTTEHFGLQSAASTTVSEAVGRASLYMVMLSGSLVALGFTSQSPALLPTFAAVALPAVFIMGIFTIGRLVDTGMQNLTYLGSIARIRSYYRTLVPSEAELFSPWGGATAAQDTHTEALAGLALRRGRRAGLSSIATMIATVNSIVGGVGATLGVYAFSRLLWPAVTVGAVVLMACLAAFWRYQNGRYASLDSAWKP